MPEMKACRVWAPSFECILFLRPTSLTPVAGIRGSCVLVVLAPVFHSATIDLDSQSDPAPAHRRSAQKLPREGPAATRRRLPDLLNLPACLITSYCLTRYFTDWCNKGSVYYPAYSTIARNYCCRLFYSTFTT